MDLFSQKKKKRPLNNFGDRIKYLVLEETQLKAQTK